MPKRKYPFEDCCNYMRQLKMHVAQAPFSNVRGEATWSPFNGSCSHSAMVNTINPIPHIPTSPFAQVATPNKKIQLFMNHKGQLCRTTQPSLPTTGSIPAAPTCCHSCGRPNTMAITLPHRCYFCEKSVCDTCIQSCANCKEEFCVLCSVKIYQSREDVTLCLSCS